MFNQRVIKSAISLAYHFPPPATPPISVPMQFVALPVTAAERESCLESRLLACRDKLSPKTNGAH